MLCLELGNVKKTMKLCLPTRRKFNLCYINCKKEEYIKVTHSQPEHNKTLFHDNMLKIIIV